MKGKGAVSCKPAKQAFCRAQGIVRFLCEAMKKASVWCEVAAKLVASRGDPEGLRNISGKSMDFVSSAMDALFRFRAVPSC